MSNRILYLFKGHPAPPQEGLIVGAKLDTAIAKGIRLQRLIPGHPIFIEKTSYYFITLTQYDLKKPVRNRNEYVAERIPLNVFSNILFKKQNSDENHLLFNYRVGISRYFLPDIGPKIYYLVVEEDTNNDGRLNQLDISTLYSSNLEGKDLKRISWENCSIKYIQHRENDPIVFLRLMYDQNLDGLFTEADYEIIKRLDLNTGLIDDIINKKMMDEIHQNIFK